MVQLPSPCEQMETGTAGAFPVPVGQASRCFLAVRTKEQAEDADAYAALRSAPERLVFFASLTY